MGHEWPPTQDVELEWILKKFFLRLSAVGRVKHNARHATFLKLAGSCRAGNYFATHSGYLPISSRSLLRSKTLVVGTPVRKGLNSIETIPELSSD